MWHNGMHLQAPVGSGASLPVCAVADGTVIFVGPTPTKPNTDVEHAQNYNPFTPDGAEKTAKWTDNGCLIIKHATTIGANGAVETAVEFYSLYMHLSAIGKTTPASQTAQRVWAAGDPIWRKDEVGTPGQVYGNAGQIHFEICCDAVNLQRLIGREPNWVAPVAAPATLPVPTADGRTDSLFGSMYFYLPADTPTDEGVAKPTGHIRRAVSGNSAGTTLQTAIWVKMTYDRGACSFESFNAQGENIGAARTQANEEYDLYKEATDRHNGLPAAAEALSSPSAWYELLRFGRNIGRGPADTDKDPLPSTPAATAAHWRRITGPNGTALWADLNAAGSFKFSDADFPAVMGWNCINDDTTPNDQRCDSEHIKALIADSDASIANRMDVEVLTARLGRTEVKQKLKRTICKFPSEWDQGSITIRYAFVKNLDAFKKAPEAWTPLEAHLKALSFAGLPTEYLNAIWRFDPREIIGHLRRCGWLSAWELAQCIPRKLVEQTKNNINQTVYPRSVLSWNQALQRSNRFHIDMSRTLRKYLISQSAQRTSYFFANCIQETMYLSRTSELGGPSLRYAPWYGRGILQLTWEENFTRYGSYRGWQNQSAANYRDSLENDIAVACDSGGFYWVSGAKTLQAVICINTEVDASPVMTQTTLSSVCDNYNYHSKSCAVGVVSMPYFNCPQLERVARAVNTGNANSTGMVNGLIPRTVVFSYAASTLTELNFSFMNLVSQRP